MKVAVIQYSTYGHITTLARAVQKGVIKSGIASQVDLFQVPETLSEEVLQLLHAPEKPADIPVASSETFKEYDAFLFGIPTRFGNLPAQWVEFWGQTGGLWTHGDIYGKPAGIFVSTGTPGGGQEATIRNAITYLTHHGLPYVPLGYAKAFPQITSFEEVHGSSPYGAGTFAGADGSRQPSKLELEIATIQGQSFAESAIKIYNAIGKKSTTTTAGGAAAAATSAPAAAQKQAATETKEKAQPAAAAAATEAKTEAKTQRGAQSTKDTAPDDKSSCKCTIV